MIMMRVPMLMLMLMKLIQRYQSTNSPINRWFLCLLKKFLPFFSHNTCKHDHEPRILHLQHFSLLFLLIRPSFELLLLLANQLLKSKLVSFKLLFPFPPTYSPSTPSLIDKSFCHSFWLSMSVDRLLVVDRGKYFNVLHQDMDFLLSIENNRKCDQCVIVTGYSFSNNLFCFTHSISFSLLLPSFSALAPTLNRYLTCF